MFTIHTNNNIYLEEYAIHINANIYLCDCPYHTNSYPTYFKAFAVVYLRIMTEIKIDSKFIANE